MTLRKDDRAKVSIGLLPAPSSAMFSWNSET